MYQEKTPLAVSPWFDRLTMNGSFLDVARYVERKIGVLIVVQFNDSRFQSGADPRSLYPDS
jgi:hypothetical protein